MIYHHDINIRQIREGGSNDDDKDDGDIRVCPNESTSMPIIVNGTECCSLFPPLPQLPLAAAEGEEEYDYYSNCCFTILANSAIGIGLRAKHFTVTLRIFFQKFFILSIFTSC